MNSRRTHIGNLWPIALGLAFLLALAASDLPNTGSEASQPAVAAAPDAALEGGPQ